jgi:hypothetical protein
MQHSRFGARVAVGIAALAAANLAPSRAAAQDTTHMTPVVDTSRDDKRIDPNAVAALEKMGAYLRTLKAFGVHALVTTEDVMEDGQKVQRSNVTDLIAVRPNKMRVDIVDQRQPRSLYYDGKTFTMWAPRVKFYATVAAPATIIDLVDTLDAKFDLEIPFVDLFRWGTPESDVADIMDATHIGPVAINGVTCEQYVFRQKGLDWQIWIQNGDYPLPLKLVLTTTSDEARPQHSAVYTWNLAPSYNDKAFVFDPPADAKKITFAEVAAARAAEKKSGGYK